jgi:hypothetical protein
MYGAAEQVIVWLGMPSEDSYAALRLFQSTELLDSKKGSENMEKDWRSVEDICLRPYWKRLWIVQEVVRAVKITVQCGAAVIGWNELSDGLESFHDRGVLRLAHHRKQYQQSGCGLIQLLETFGNCVCFDPRDKVYGLLGLANDCEIGTVAADYNKSTAEVFADIVAFYYHQSLEQEVSQPNMHWRSPGMVRFTRLLRNLLFEDEIPDPKDSGRGGDGELNVFHFVGFFTGTVSLVGPMLDSVRDSLHQRNNLVATWYNAIQPRPLEERHHVYESIKSGITRTRRVLSIEGSVSHATIG